MIAFSHKNTFYEVKTHTHGDFYNVDICHGEHSKQLLQITLETRSDMHIQNGSTDKNLVALAINLFKKRIH